MSQTEVAIPRRPVRPRVISWRSDLASVLAISGYGVRLFVRRGQLIVEDGFANEGSRRQIALSHGTCKLQRIVMLGRSGFVTLDGLQWLADLGIALLFVGAGGRLASVFSPGGAEGGTVKLHRVQAAARKSSVGIRVARQLIGGKLEGQREIVEWLARPGKQSFVPDRRRIEAMREASRELASCAADVKTMGSVDEIVQAERSGAESYWRVRRGFP